MRATMAQYHRVAVRAPERLPAPLDREGALQATTQTKGAWSGIPFAVPDQINLGLQWRPGRGLLNTYSDDSVTTLGLVS